MATRIDSSGWRRKRARMQKTRLSARIDATRELGVTLARNVAIKVPKDTNRLARAYAEAHNMLAVNVRMPPPPLKPSKDLDRHVARIRKQVVRAEAEVERWSRNVQTYVERRQSATFSGAQARTYLEKWKKQLRAARRELKKIEERDDISTLVVIGGRRRKNADRNEPSAGTARAVFKVYGGAGTIREAAGRLFVEVRSREPHTNIVNKKTGVVTREVNLARSAGARRVSHGYIKKLAEAARKAA